MFFCGLLQYITCTVFILTNLKTNILEIYFSNPTHLKKELSLVIGAPVSSSSLYIYIHTCILLTQFTSSFFYIEIRTYHECLLHNLNIFRNLSQSEFKYIQVLFQMTALYEDSFINNDKTSFLCTYFLNTHETIFCDKLF